METSYKAVLVSLFAAVLLGATVTVAQEPADAADSPLVETTKAFLGTWNQRRDADQNAAFRERALALADSLEAERELSLAAQCLERAGIVSYMFKEMDRALEIWERGLVIARTSGDPSRITALLNAKASGLSASGDDAAALDLQRELLGLRRALGDVRGEAVTLYNMGVSQRALFQYPEAIESLRGAMQRSLESGHEIGRALSASLLGGMLVHYGRFDDALALADSSVAICERIGNPYYFAVVSNTRATILDALGRDAEALADIDRALEAFETAGAAAAGDMVRANRVDALVSLGRAEESIAEARATLRDFTDRGENVVLAEAVLGRALLNAGRNDEAREVLEAAVHRYHAFQDSLEGDVARSDAARIGSAVTYLALLHARAGRVREAWQLVEANEARGDGGDADSPVTLARLQERLAARRAVLVQYGQASAEGCPVFLITPDTITFHEIRDVVEVRTLSAEFGELLAGGSEGERLDTVRIALSDHLLAPFREVLVAGDRVVIAPGAYAGIAFEALYFDEDADFGESRAISYSPSAEAFLELDDRVAPAGGFVGLADATTDSVRGSGLWVERLRSVAGVPLPESRAEIDDVAPAGATLYVGALATIDAFTASASGASVLHVATHAIVDTGHPEASALVLANTEEDDGVLLARDIAALPLNNDLVCLSACQTARGYRSLGAGAFGLTRAFFRSGARTVVSTWWDVEDRAARRFMSQFYAALREGLDRDEAARRARVTMREEGFSRRDRAAFAVSGAATGSLAAVLGGVDTTSPARTVLGVVGLVCVAAFLVARRRRPRPLGD